MTSCQSTPRRTVEDDIIALNQISNVKQKIETVGGRTTKKREKCHQARYCFFFSTAFFSKSCRIHRYPRIIDEECYIRTQENKYP
jgi:hypothetical protein